MDPTIICHPTIIWNLNLSKTPTTIIPAQLFVISEYVLCPRIWEVLYRVMWVVEYKYVIVMKWVAGGDMGCLSQMGLRVEMGHRDEIGMLE